MRIFAVLTMLIAWLLYGAMPALANCPICDSGMTMPAATMTTRDAMADMPGMTMHHDILAVHGKDKPANPCADGMAHVPSCAACLAVPPQLAADLGKVLAFSYPVPTSGRALTGFRPAPVAPPPRFA